MSIAEDPASTQPAPPAAVTGVPPGVELITAPRPTH